MQLVGPALHPTMRSRPLRIRGTAYVDGVSPSALAICRTAKALPLNHGLDRTIRNQTCYLLPTNVTAAPLCPLLQPSAKPPHSTVKVLSGLRLRLP